MSRNDAQLKCTWTNCVIWAVIMSAVSVLFRFAMWWFVLGSEALYYVVSDAAFNTAAVMLCVPFVLAVIPYAIMYRGYMKIAGDHASELDRVARDKHGKPAIVPVILLLVLEGLWAAISLILWCIGNEMEIIHSADDRLAFVVVLCIHLGSLALDLVLFFLGKRFFKPSEVQRHH